MPTALLRGTGTPRPPKKGGSGRLPRAPRRPGLVPAPRLPQVSVGVCSPARVGRVDSPWFRLALLAAGAQPSTLLLALTLKPPQTPRPRWDHGRHLAHASPRLGSDWQLSGPGRRGCLRMDCAREPCLRPHAALLTVAREQCGSRVTSALSATSKSANWLAADAGPSSLCTGPARLQRDPLERFRLHCHGAAREGAGRRVRGRGTR